MSSMLFNCPFVLIATAQIAGAVLITDLCDRQNIPARVVLARRGENVGLHEVYGPDYTVSHPGSVVFIHNPNIANMSYVLGKQPYLSHNDEEVDLGTYVEPELPQLDDSFAPRSEKIEMPFRFQGCPPNPVLNWGDSMALEFSEKQALTYDTESTPEKQWTAFGYAPFGADISPRKLSSHDFVDAVLETVHLPAREIVERDGVFISMVETHGQLDETRVRNLTNGLSVEMSMPKSAACARIYSYNNKLGYTFAYGLSKPAVKSLDCKKFEAQKVYYTWAAPLLRCYLRSRRPRTALKIFGILILLALAAAVYYVLIKRRKQGQDPLQPRWSRPEVE